MYLPPPAGTSEIYNSDMFVTSYEQNVTNMSESKIFDVPAGGVTSFKQNVTNMSESKISDAPAGGGKYTKQDNKNDYPLLKGAAGFPICSRFGVTCPVGSHPSAASGNNLTQL